MAVEKEECDSELCGLTADVRLCNEMCNTFTCQKGAVMSFCKQENKNGLETGSRQMSHHNSIVSGPLSHAHNLVFTCGAG